MQKITRNAIGIGIAVLFLFAGVYVYDFYTVYSVASNICKESNGKTFSTLKQEIEQNRNIEWFKLTSKNTAVLKINSNGKCEFALENDKVRSYKIDFSVPKKEWKYEFNTGG